MSSSNHSKSNFPSCSTKPGSGYCNNVGVYKYMWLHNVPMFYFFSKCGYNSVLLRSRLATLKFLNLLAVTSAATFILYVFNEMGIIYISAASLSAAAGIIYIFLLLNVVDSKNKFLQQWKNTFFSSFCYKSDSDSLLKPYWHLEFISVILKGLVLYFL